MDIYAASQTHTTLPRLNFASDEEIVPKLSEQLRRISFLGKVRRSEYDKFAGSIGVISIMADEAHEKGVSGAKDLKNAIMDWAEKAEPCPRNNRQ
jgi:hypothetical protein